MILDLFVFLPLLGQLRAAPALEWVPGGEAGPSLRFGTTVLLRDLPQGSDARALDTDGDGVPGMVVRVGHALTADAWLQVVEVHGGVPTVSPPFAPGGTFFPFDQELSRDALVGPAPIHVLSDHNVHSWYGWVEGTIREVPWPALPGGEAPLPAPLAGGAADVELGRCEGEAGLLTREIDFGLWEFSVDGRRVVVADAGKVWRSADLEVRFEGVVRYDGLATLILTRGGAETRVAVRCHSGG